MGLITGLLLSMLIGLSLGVLGGGDSLSTVLVYVLGVEPHPAIGMSLAVVGATSALAATLHYRRGTLCAGLSTLSQEEKRHATHRVGP